MPKTFKILALCDCLDKVYDLEQALIKESEDELQYLLCNNRRRSSLRYFAAEIVGFLRRGSKRKWLVVFSLFLKGKIFLSSNELSSQKVLSWLKKKRFDIGLHAMGVIYKKAVIDTFLLGIINPHIGKLPEMRGRCVMEWSLLYNIPTGVSSFFIDSGIDTGSKLLFFEPYDLPLSASINAAKAFLFSRDIAVFNKSLRLLRETEEFQFNDVSQGKRYYVMSTLLLGVIEKKLEHQKQHSYTCSS